jgi:hypothetical protein
MATPSPSKHPVLIGMPIVSATTLGSIAMGWSDSRNPATIAIPSFLDGRWIAFLSDRGTPEKAAQVYVIALNSGEPFPVTLAEEEIHAFTWSADSGQIYFATRAWTKDQQEAYKKDWKDIIEFRESERGDAIHRIAISEAKSCLTETPAKTCDLSTRSSHVASTPWRVKQLETSPGGRARRHAYRLSHRALGVPGRLRNLSDRRRRE